MASYLPPSEQLPIFDNEVFSNQNDPNAVLTIATANLLYLKKTVPDFASALETFNGGIDTSFLNSLSATTNLTIGTNLISGEIFIGATPTATATRTGHIHIGDANNLPAGAGVHINNGTNNASNTGISNGASTTGNVNIMSGNTSNGIVNIKTGTGAGSINFGNTSGTQTINFNRPLTLGYLSSAISASTLGFSQQTIPATSTQTGNFTYASITIATAGIYLLNCNAQFTGSATQIYAQLIGTNVIGAQNYVCPVFINPGTNYGLNINQVVECTASTYSVTILLSGSISATYGYFKATRIA